MCKTLMKKKTPILLFYDSAGEFLALILDIATFIYFGEVGVPTEQVCFNRSMRWWGESPCVVGGGGSK